MLDKVATLNRMCYKEKIQVVSTFNTIKTLLEGKDKREQPRRLLCANEKEYMGSVLSYTLKVLTMLKENKQLFGLFVTALQSTKDLSDEYLDMLATDLVYLFFSDFTSNERSILNILRQFEHLIQAKHLQ